jgi:ferredoxin-type protein NapF
MRNIFRLSNLRTLSTILAFLLVIPVSWKSLTGVFTWLSPYVMLNSVFALKSIVWLNIISLPVVLFIMFRRRWFCHHLCPVGWSCDKVSGISKRKNLTYNSLPDIGKWMAVLSISAAIVGFPLFIFFDPLAIFSGFFTIFSGEFTPVIILIFSAFPLLLIIHLFLPGIWCAKLCPLGGLQLVISDIMFHLKRIFKKKESGPVTLDSGRRYFLMSGIGLITGLTIPRLLKPSPEEVIRPPASVDTLLFNSLCTRCGNCNKVCPTGIIIPHTDYSDILSWMTPEVSFKTGYCLETCNLCSKVCPSGAITLFSAEAKKQIFMGTAEVQLENCLLVNNKECIKCKESCKYEAIEFVADNNVLNMMPLVDIKKCVGCGACAVVCPEECITIKPVI